MALIDWITLLASLFSVGLLLRTWWVAHSLSRRASHRMPYAKGHVFLGLTLLLLFVTLTVAAALVLRGGSPEHLLVSILVLSCSLFVSILVRDQGQLERLVAHRTAELTTVNSRLQSLLDNMP